MKVSNMWQVRMVTIKIKPVTRMPTTFVVFNDDDSINLSAMVAIRAWQNCAHYHNDADNDCENDEVDDFDDDDDDAKTSQQWWQPGKKSSWQNRSTSCQGGRRGGEAGFGWLSWLS